MEPRINTPPLHSKRTACDRCHRKKVWCVLSRGKDACVRCLTHGVPCFFTATARMGRPSQRSVSRDAAEYDKSGRIMTAAWSMSSPSSSASLGQLNDNFLPSPMDFDDFSHLEGQQGLSVDLDKSVPSLENFPGLIFAGIESPLEGELTDSSDPMRASDSTQSALLSAQKGLEFDHLEISQPDGGTNNESLPSLFELQQDIVKLKGEFLSSLSSFKRLSSYTAVGTLLDLTDRFQMMVNQVFSSDSTGIGHDSSTSILLVGTMALVLEIYELVVSAVKPQLIESPLRKRMFHPSPKSDTSPPTSSANSSGIQIKIKNFIPSDDLADWISVNTLLYQLHMTRNTLRTMRECFSPKTRSAHSLHLLESLLTRTTVVQGVFEQIILQYRYCMDYPE